jgi:hypothetical protein
MWAVINIENVQNIDPNLIVRYSELQDKVLIEFNENLIQYIIQGPLNENEKDFLLTTHEWLVMLD